MICPKRETQIARNPAPKPPSLANSVTSAAHRLSPTQPLTRCSRTTRKRRNPLRFSALRWIWSFWGYPKISAIADYTCQYHPDTESSNHHSFGYSCSPPPNIDCRLRAPGPITDFLSLETVKRFFIPFVRRQNVGFVSTRPYVLVAVVRKLKLNISAGIIAHDHRLCSISVSLCGTHDKQKRERALSRQPKEIFADSVFYPCSVPLSCRRCFRNDAPSIESVVLRLLHRGNWTCRFPRSISDDAHREAAAAN